MDTGVGHVFASVEQSEDLLMKRKKILYEVQDEVNKHRKSIVKLEHECDFLEKEVKALEEQKVQLEIGLKLEGQLVEHYSSRLREAEERTRKTRSTEEEAYSRTVLRYEQFEATAFSFLDSIDCDDLGYVQRPQRLMKEIQRLRLEEGSLQCEIQLLEDKLSCQVSLREDIRKLGEEIKSMQQEDSSVETALLLELTSVKAERDSLIELGNCPEIQRLQGEIETIKEELSTLEALQHFSDDQNQGAQEKPSTTQWSSSQHLRQSLPLVKPTKRNVQNINEI
ncbi:uncharacterized protein LOC143037663 [Oratosquilla oratoria]|uniref:uncharacterized protein LOC143037663 n=1 Tax=Oratosquilla oratoria TaxID=337810 RepID=UPI003F766D4F